MKKIYKHFLIMSLALLIVGTSFKSVNHINSCPTHTYSVSPVEKNSGK